MWRVRRGLDGVLGLRTSRGYASGAKSILTGLNRDPEAAQKLLGVYQESQAALARLPAECYYGQTLGATLQQRIALLTTTSGTRRGQVDDAGGDEAGEEAFGEGTLEEILEQAVAERELIAKFEAWRPWEELECPPPEGQWASPAVLDDSLATSGH